MAVVFIALILETVLKILRSVIGAWADTRYEHLHAIKAFNCVLNTSIHSFDNESTGSFLDKLSSVTRLKNFYTGQLIVSAIDIPFIVLFLLLMAYIAGFIALIPVVMLIIYAYLSHHSNKHLSEQIAKRQEGDDKRTSFVINALSHIHTLKANALEEMLLVKYRYLLEKTALIDYDMVLIGGKKNAYAQLITQTNLLLIVGFGAWAILEGNMSLGALAACSFLANRIMQPVGRIASLWTRLQSVRFAEERLEELLTLPPESLPNDKTLIAYQGGIEIKALCLVPKKKINLVIKPGEIIALVGETLSGKTHLMMMLTKMADITTGDILLDGVSIKQLTSFSVREHIQYVTQEPVSFQGTLLDNITMFNKSRIEKAYEITKELGLDKVIAQMPLGYDTMMADSAVEILPKGIRQMINIARALTGEPKVILFDEANTAFDEAADMALMMALERHRGEFTVIFVSPSYNRVIERADVAYLLKGGEINVYRS